MKQEKQAEEAERRKRLEYEAKVRAQVAAQIEEQARVLPLDSVSQCDGMSVRSLTFNKERSKRDKKDKLYAKAHDEFRDDVSQTSNVSLGASKHLEDAMIASNKDE